MLKIKILSVGKNKEQWLEAGCTEYVKRLAPIMAIDFVWVKNNDQLVEMVKKEKTIIVLDVSGKSMDSKAFSAYLTQKIEESGGRLTFVIGGAEGLPEPLKGHSNGISFSPLTFTHQLIRLLLLEQIYRALEIVKGSPYHK